MRLAMRSSPGGSRPSCRRFMELPLWLTIVILGIIEGITEFLPVSSTGHLLLAQHWLPRQSDLFNVVIQSGAVVAVIPLFRERVVRMVQWRDAESRDYARKVLAAFAISAALGAALEFGGFTLPEEPLPVAVALLAGGVAFLVIERIVRGREKGGDITWAAVVVVGLFQIVAAMFPGTSRSGATIMPLLLLGLARPAATEFSFLVGIPTMLAAGGGKMFLELRNAGAAAPGAPGEDWAMLALGFLVSAAVSFVAVKWLLGYIQNHTFEIFGWYRIGVALVFFAIIYFAGGG